MKKTVLNLLAVASVLTTASFLLDGDLREPSMIMRFVEYILMLATFFTITSGFYFGIKAIVNRIKVAR
mgnify:FL=1